MFNVLGDPIRRRTAGGRSAPRWRSTAPHRPSPTGMPPRIFWRRASKVIDPGSACHHPQGAARSVCSAAQRAKTVLIQELIPQRGRRAWRLLHLHRCRRTQPETTTSGVKMREQRRPPRRRGVRPDEQSPRRAYARVPAVGLTWPEYFPRRRARTCCSSSTIFSALCRRAARLPCSGASSAAGYQPTLANEMGEPQERITSTSRTGLLPSAGAGGVGVPADDLTDPASLPPRSPSDATTVLSRKIAESRAFIPRSTR